MVLVSVASLDRGIAIDLIVLLPLLLITKVGN